MSNGFAFRFSEAPDPHLGLGYIVPEPLELAELLPQFRAPGTHIILPLKLGLEKRIQRELSAVAPETILFLSKISRLHIINQSVVKTQVAHGVEVSITATEFPNNSNNNNSNNNKVTFLYLDSICVNSNFRHAYIVVFIELVSFP